MYTNAAANPADLFFFNQPKKHAWKEQRKEIWGMLLSIKNRRSLKRSILTKVRVPCPLSEGVKSHVYKKGKPRQVMPVAKKSFDCASREFVTSFLNVQSIMKFAGPKRP